MATTMCALVAGGVEVPGETILFYGCRKRDEDYLYREEIEQCVWPGSSLVSFRCHGGGLAMVLLMLKSSFRSRSCRYVKGRVITQLEVAFSREQAHKVYVTHLLEQQGEAVWRCLGNGGHLYVCGYAALFSQVQAALQARKIAWTLLYISVARKLIPRCLFNSDAKNMARDVHTVLRDIIVKHGGLDEQAAEEYIQGLHAKGRYEQDVWS